MTFCGEKMKEALFRLFRKLRPRNLSRKARIIMERCRGLDFSAVIQPEEVGYDSNIAHRSSPSGNKYLVHLLKDLSVTENDSIIDIGSGKGSAMLSMLRFPFARVDGVELSEHIADIAIRNFRKLNVKRTHVFNCDARTFQHYDHYNMFYFYNPFSVEIMSGVISNIYQSIQGTDREILIIYNNPVYHDLIINQGVFSKIKEYPDEWGNQQYVYSNRNPEHSRLNR